MIRRWHSSVEEILIEGGRPLESPQRRVVVAAVLVNPVAGHWVDDLGELSEFGGVLSAQMAERAQSLLGNPVRAFGKAGIVGTNGELEHVAAVLHPKFGQPLRAAVGGAALLQSTKKRGGPGAVIDIPISHVDDMAIRSHFDTTCFMVPDAPLPDEMVICLAVSDGPRAHQRIGGKTEPHDASTPTEAQP